MLTKIGEEIQAVALLSFYFIKLSPFMNNTVEVKCP